MKPKDHLQVQAAERLAATDCQIDLPSNGRVMQTTTHEERPTSGRYLTMREAGGIAGKSAKWALEHLRKTPGSPACFEIPAPEGRGQVTNLVRECDWIEFLESFEVAPLDRERTVTAGTLRRQVPMAQGLMSPSQRKKLERAVAARAN